jgi:heptosyltransferase I
LGTPIVGIYGPTRPSRNGPWSPADTVVSRDATCDCHHLRRCRRATMCLMDIEVEEVLNAAERRLAAEPTRV